MRAQHPISLALVLSLVLWTKPGGTQVVIRSAPDTGATVPMELAQALLGGYGAPGGGAADLVVGRLPADFPAELALPGIGTVLGGLTHGAGEAQMGRASIAVLASPQRPAEALAIYETRLERGGWRRAPGAERRGGFLPAPVSRPGMFCRDGMFVTVFATPRPAGGSHLRLNLRHPARMSPCDRERRQEVRDDAPPPMLRAPDGAATLSGGTMSGGPTTREMSTRLETRLPPAELVAHYAAQLEQARWSLGPLLTAEGVAVQSAQHSDAEGRVWHGLLTAVALPGSNEREVIFRFMRANLHSR